MIYLDNSATTKPCVQAVEAMMKAMSQDWANPSALYAFGIDAAYALKDARKQLSSAMGAEPDRVFFTSGGTEADNWAIFGTVKRFGKRGKHIITTAMEHHAVLNCMKDLENQGFEITYLQPDSQGSISLDALKAALRKDTILVSVIGKSGLKPEDYEKPAPSDLKAAFDARFELVTKDNIDKIK